MNVGTRSHDILTSDINELIAFCKGNDVDGLHLALYKSFEKEFHDEELMKKYINEIENNGIKIFVHGAYFNMIHPDKAKYLKGRELFNYVASLAMSSNCRVVASETGSVNGDQWTYNEANHTPKSIEQATKTIEELTENTNGATLAVEPVYDHVIYNIDEAKKIADNTPIKIVLDLSNLLNINNSDNYLNIFEEALLKLGDKIEILHCKNFTWQDGEKAYCSLVNGHIDYIEIHKLLNKYGYADLPLIIEDLQGQELIESIKYLKEMK